jgi:hypothetical protein
VVESYIQIRPHLPVNVRLLKAHEARLTKFDFEINAAIKCKAAHCLKRMQRLDIVNGINAAVTALVALPKRIGQHYCQ